jgi:hypothetical protein
VFHDQVHAILTKHGINVQRSPKEVLAELREAGVGDCAGSADVEEIGKR